jgi:hypothetical protein
MYAAIYILFVFNSAVVSVDLPNGTSICAVVDDRISPLSGLLAIVSLIVSTGVNHYEFDTINL